MEKLKKTSHRIKELLEENKDTRKDELYLYEEFLDCAKPGLGKLARVIHNYMRAGKIPKWEGMSRARRKVQQHHPELKDEKTAQYRELEEEKYKEFARC